MANSILDYIIQEMFNPKVPNSPMITPQQVGEASPQGNPQFMNNLIRGLSEIPTPLGALDTMASPQVDLGTINVNPQRQQQTQSQPPPMPVASPPSLPPSLPPEAQRSVGGGGIDLGGIGEFLKRAGIPLGAAIAGTAFPGVLPQASGLATGFEGTKLGLEKEERERKKEEIGTRPFIIVDPDTGEQTTINVPKKAIVQQKRKGDFWSQFDPTVKQKMEEALYGGESSKSNLTEENIRTTMEKRGLTREQVLKALGKTEKDVVK